LGGWHNIRSGMDMGLTRKSIKKSVISFFKPIVVIACLIWLMCNVKIPFIYIRGGIQDRIRVSAGKVESEIADFIESRKYSFADFLPEQLMQSCKQIKKITKLDDNFYLIHASGPNFLYSHYLLLGEVPKQSDTERNDSSFIFFCDTKSKGYFNHNKKEMFGFSYIRKSGMHFPMAVKLTLPPVPGCIFHYDGEKDGVIMIIPKTIEYPELARKRFKIYYPELYDELVKLNYIIPCFDIERGVDYW
jgi:hypothetical protein